MEAPFLENWNKDLTGNSQEFIEIDRLFGPICFVHGLLDPLECCVRRFSQPSAPRSPTLPSPSRGRELEGHKHISASLTVKLASVLSAFGISSTEMRRGQSNSCSAARSARSQCQVPVVSPATRPHSNPSPTSMRVACATVSLSAT